MGHVIKSIDKKHTVNSIMSKNTIEKNSFRSKKYKSIEQASTRNIKAHVKSMVTVMERKNKKKLHGDTIKTHIRFVYKQKFEFHKSKFVALSV